MGWDDVRSIGSQKEVWDPDKVEGAEVRSDLVYAAVTRNRIWPSSLWKDAKKILGILS